MKMQTEITVVGMKANKGQLDNGTAYDSTKVFCLTDLDDRRGKAKGQAVAEYNIGTSEEYDKFAHLSFPFKALAEVEVVTTGKGQQVIVTGLKPVSNPAKAA
jgi:hypothetical protein